MPTKKEIEQQAESDALYAREAARQAQAEKDKKEEADRQKLSFFGKIWDVVSDNFWLIALAVVAFAVMGPEKMKDLWNKGTEMLGNLFDKGIEMLPEKWQSGLNAMLGRDVSGALAEMDITKIRETLAEKKVPAEIIAVLAPNKETFQSFLDVARNANGGKVGADDFTNDKTVFALLTQKPDMARALAAVALKGGGAAASSPAAAEIKASLKAIVADGRLDVLLNPPHLENTKALLGAMPNVDAGQLDTLLKSQVVDGKATPALRKFLTTILSPSANGAQPDVVGAVQQLSSEVTPETRKVLVDAAMQVKPSDSAEIKALKTNNGGKALAALRASLGDEKLMQFVAIHAGGNELAEMKFALENRGALEVFQKAADVKKLGPETQAVLTQLASLPANATAPLLGVIKNGINPLDLKRELVDKAHTTSDMVARLITDSKARDLIAQAGAEYVVPLMKAFAPTKVPSTLTPTALNAVLVAAETIGASESMRTPNGKRDTLRVVSAIADVLVNHKPEAISKLKPEELAAFFNDATNAGAVRQLMATLAPTLPKEQAAMANALLAHWQTVERVAADKEGAQLFMAQLAKIGNAPQAKAGVLGGASEWLSNTTTDIGLSYEQLRGSVIGKNADEIRALRHDFEVAAHVAATPATPAQTPKQQNFLQSLAAGSPLLR